LVRSYILRYFLQIAYKGTNYHGWQLQPNATSVQDVFNKCLSLQLSEEIYCVGCGRTDTGVHAKKFFLHFDSENDLNQIPNFLHKLNVFLPKDIVVEKVFKAKPEAHARFSATERTYQYFINLKKDPFSLDYATFIHYKPDVEKMNEAAALLLHYEDFEAFSKVSEDQAHHRCNITFAKWELLEKSEDKLIFKITANRFLRGMVRLVVGTLLQVGRGKITIEKFREILEGKDRKFAASAAPSDGLYLWDVVYPEGILEELVIIKNH
jgi:tRNA pseudouridine38-40 synthase